MFRSLVLVFRSEGDRISSVRHLGRVWGLSSLCLSAYNVFLIHQIMNLLLNTCMSCLENTGETLLSLGTVLK